jgi:MoaA/NifB/PqqE/SkfB family radical SAM enzyme
MKEMKETNVSSKFIPKKELYFEVDLTQHCNLNCAYCFHYSPIAKEIYLDVDKYNNDLARLQLLCDGNVSHILLLGGEPLLHPKINEIMDITRRRFNKVTNIIIVTNGTLLTKQPSDFWDKAAFNNVWIAITPYPISINVDEIRKLAIKHGVTCGLYCGGATIKGFSALEMMSHEKMMSKLSLDLKGSQDITQSFVHCGNSNACISLRDGKLYTCSILPHIEHLVEYFNLNLAVTEDDYIDIYKAQNKDELLNFLAKPVPFCRFCKTMSISGGHEWRVSTKKIEEWV